MSSKGGRSAFMPATTSISPVPSWVAKAASLANWSYSSGAENSATTCTCPDFSAATCACGSEMKRATMRSSAGFSPQYPSHADMIARSPLRHSSSLKGPVPTGAVPLVSADDGSTITAAGKPSQ